MRSTSKPNLFQQVVGFMILLFITSTVSAQLVPISLAQRIEKSTTVLEGKVVSQTSYWDETKTYIYTSNVVEVYKLFKGKLNTDKVEVITRGGIVGDRMERVTNMLELKIGETGVFTAVDNMVNLVTSANLTKLNTYAGIQGFIKYDLSNSSAKDMFNKYNNITKEVYSKIVALTHNKFKTIKKAPFKLRNHD